MTLRLTCPVCKHRLKYDLQDGIVYCLNCGYQPFHEWSKMAPEAAQPRITPLRNKLTSTAELEVITCPQCGGDDLLPISDRNAIRCPDCNATYPIQVDINTGPHTLRGTHLQRQGKSIIWEIDRRILNCPTCGAQVTLHHDDLTTVCPFCDSKHVVAQDSHRSFEAPDAIVPFSISTREVRELVEARLTSGWHGLMRIFRDRVVRISGSPLYLPWWSFAVKVDVYWRYSKFFGRNGIDRQIIDIPPIYAAMTYHEIIPRLWPYDLRYAHDYEPHYLAKIQAEIPRIKVQECAPDAIQQAINIAEKRVRAKKPVSVTMQTQQKRAVRDFLRLASHARQINYRLLLLPVWIIQLYEIDGDTRRAFVNGQTGEVVLEGGVLWGVLSDSGRASRTKEGR